MAVTEETLNVSVIFARPDVQTEIRLAVPRGVTVRAVIERSRILDSYPEIDLAVNKVGIFGELRDLSTTVQDGDRVEIYRPLLIDPKESRRRNAAAAPKKRV